MTKEQQVILTLIKVAISRENVSLPNYVNWANVIEIATEQGVLGITFDALDIIKIGESEVVRGESILLRVIN